MVNSDFNIKKLYYSIREVSEMTGLKQYVLRYWETEFPMLSPQKNRAGNRTYRQKDIETILQIKNLLYERKFTIEGARRQLKMNEDQNKGKLSYEDNIYRYQKLLDSLKRELKEILDVIAKDQV